MHSLNYFLRPVSFQLDELEVYDNKYVKIETEMNGPIGLINAVSGKIVIPLQHDFLNLVEEKLWIGRIEHGKEGLYDLSGRLLLEHKYDDIKVRDGFIHATIYGDGTRDRKEEIFDFAGNRVKDK